MAQTFRPCRNGKGTALAPEGPPVITSTNRAFAPVKPLYFNYRAQLPHSLPNIISQNLSGFPLPTCYSESRGVYPPQASPSAMLFHYALSQFETIQTPQGFTAYRTVPRSAKRLRRGKWPTQIFFRRPLLTRYTTAPAKSFVLLWSCTTHLFSRGYAEGVVVTPLES
jgi:hypothetical protein